MARTNRFATMYVLSPFVWRDGDIYRMLVRAVPRRDDEPRLKMAEIFHGVSKDGLHFEMDIAPAIFPGPDDIDLDGCEDPTVLAVGGGLHVWYTGYHEAEKKGRLMLARGQDVATLEKQGVALNATEKFDNPKEATVVRGAKGWRMFFEFARGGASLIGEVSAKTPDGPWADRKDGPIMQREDRWDCWHLSPGPVIGEHSDAPVMFYNGATQDAKWRIGWAAFDKGFSRVIDRCEEPLISPDGQRATDATDIAFAASAVEDGDKIHIYYSQSDQDLRRATILRK